MKISELIEALKKFQDKHGDIDCYCLMDVTGSNEVNLDVNGDIMYSEVASPKVQYMYKDEYDEVMFLSQDVIDEVSKNNKYEEDFGVSEYVKICTLVDI